jgi:putative resolvase
MERLKDYVAAQGYPVTRMVQDIGSELNERRPKLLKLLDFPNDGVMVLEHRDRGTCFGFPSMKQLFAMQEQVMRRRSDD